jgi:hypothetical protein
MTRSMSRRCRVLAVAVLAPVTISGCNSGSSTSEAKFAPIAKVTPSCIKPGEVATVTVTGAPSANIVVVPVYSIGFAVNSTAPPTGDADIQGNFTTKWTVPSGAPAGLGKARIAIAGGKDVKQVEAPFDIASSNGDCPPPTVTTKPAASSTTRPSTAATKPGETTTSGATTTFPNATTTTEVPAVNGGDFKTTVTMGKSCVEPGQKQTIKVQTIENGVVSYSIGYADFSPAGGNANAGSAGSKGHYEDTFVVPPGTNKGRALAQAAVAAKGGRRSFAGTHFDVGNC